MVECVRDYDYHPRESFARLFTTTAAGIRRFDDTALVTDALHTGNVILRHYAFNQRWIKVNVTFSSDGELVETGPGPASLPAFAFNCDLATPMHREGDDVFAVDLFLDVLVRADAQTYAVTDESAFERAAAEGLISAREAASARVELEELVRLVDSRRLLPWLESVCPIVASTAPPAQPVLHLPVPRQLHPCVRWTW